MTRHSEFLQNATQIYGKNCSRNPSGCRGIITAGCYMSALANNDSSNTKYRTMIAICSTQNKGNNKHSTECTVLVHRGAWKHTCIFYAPGHQSFSSLPTAACALSVEGRCHEGLACKQEYGCRGARHFPQPYPFCYESVDVQYNS